MSRLDQPLSATEASVLTTASPNCNIFAIDITVLQDDRILNTLSDPFSQIEMYLVVFQIHAVCSQPNRMRLQGYTCPRHGQRPQDLDQMTTKVQLLICCLFQITPYGRLEIVENQTDILGPNASTMQGTNMIIQECQEQEPICESE